MENERTIIGYMDKVDFDYELGAAKGGNRVYPSQKDLEECQPCTQECGIVEVEVRLKRVIAESDFSKSTEVMSQIRRHRLERAAKTLSRLLLKKFRKFWRLQNLYRFCDHQQNRNCTCSK